MHICGTVKVLADPNPKPQAKPCGSSGKSCESSGGNAHKSNGRSSGRSCSSRSLHAASDVAVEKEYCQLPLSESLLHSVHSYVGSIHDFAKPRLRVVGLSEKARQWTNERHNKKQSNTNTHTHIPSLSWLG